MSEALFRVGVMLATLALAGSLAKRAGQSVIPAYILAGVVIGPHVPTAVGGVSVAVVENGTLVRTLADLGVVFLLFFLGVEFELGDVLENRNRVLAVGGIDLAINFPLGLLLGYLFGFGPMGAVLLAGIVYISSSAIVTKSLVANGWVADPESETILGTLIVEDLVIAVYLAVVSAVLSSGGGLFAAATSVATSAVFLGGVMAAAWYGSGWLERLLRTESTELLLLRAVGTTVLVAGAALSLGASEAVAAFFVGAGIGRTDLAGRIEHLVTPLRDLFAAVFFCSIGIVTDLTLLPGVAALLAVAVVLTTLSKLASGWLSGRAYGLSDRRSVRVALGLVARGEFSLVIAAIAAATGVEPLSTTLPAFAVGYVLVMSLLGTFCIRYAGTLTRLVGLPEPTAGEDGRKGLPATTD